MKISGRLAGKVEYASKFKAAHSGGGPKYPPHNGANESLLLERRVQYPQVIAKVVSTTLDQRS